MEFVFNSMNENNSESKYEEALQKMKDDILISFNRLKQQIGIKLKDQKPITASLSKTLEVMQQLMLIFMLITQYLKNNHSDESKILNLHRQIASLVHEISKKDAHDDQNIKSIFTLITCQKDFAYAKEGQDSMPDETKMNKKQPTVTDHELEKNKKKNNNTEYVMWDLKTKYKICMDIFKTTKFGSKISEHLDVETLQSLLNVVTELSKCSTKSMDSDIFQRQVIELLIILNEKILKKGNSKSKDAEAKLLWQSENLNPKKRVVNIDIEN